MKKLIIVGLFLFCLIIVNAEVKAGKDKRKRTKAKPQLILLTVTGIISKSEEAGKDGKSIYILTSPSKNIVSLPSLKISKKTKEGAAPVINLNDFIDLRVTIVGKGYARLHKGKQKVSIKKIIGIRKVTSN